MTSTWYLTLPKTLPVRLPQTLPVRNHCSATNKQLFQLYRRRLQASPRRHLNSDAQHLASMMVRLCLRITNSPQQPTCATRLPRTRFTSAQLMPATHLAIRYTSSFQCILVARHSGPPSIQCVAHVLRQTPLLSAVILHLRKASERCSQQRAPLILCARSPILSTLLQCIRLIIAMSAQSIRVSHCALQALSHITCPALPPLRAHKSDSPQLNVGRDFACSAVMKRSLPFFPTQSNLPF